VIQGVIYIFTKPDMSQLESAPVEQPTTPVL
jgi:hypothetical protein